MLTQTMMEGTSVTSLCASPAPQVKVKRKFIPIACTQVECEVGKPKVNFRETIRGRAEFNYLHKKQSGGSGREPGSGFGRNHELLVGAVQALDHLHSATAQEPCSCKPSRTHTPCVILHSRCCLIYLDPPSLDASVMPPAGQFGRVIGYIESMDDVPGQSSSGGSGASTFEFQNKVRGVCEV